MKAMRLSLIAAALNTVLFFMAAFVFWDLSWYLMLPDLKANVRAAALIVWLWINVVFAVFLFARPI